METPTGVLVIRVWLEKSAEKDELRSRIKLTLDVSKPATIEKAARSEDEIIGVVRDWLRAFVTTSSTQD